MCRAARDEAPAGADVVLATMTFFDSPCATILASVVPGGCAYNVATNIPSSITATLDSTLFLEVNAPVTLAAGVTYNVTTLADAPNGGMAEAS